MSKNPLFLMLIFFVMVSNAHAMPSFQEIKDSYKKSDAVLLDRHGDVIHELRVDPKGRRLDWVSHKRHFAFFNKGGHSIRGPEVL